MKISRSKMIESKALRFLDLRNSIKELGQEIETLRTELMGTMGDSNALSVGDFVLLISERIRTDLDRKSLEQFLGEELDQFINESTYKTFEVKRA